jgi:hypothetical protein
MTNVVATTRPSIVSPHDSTARKRQACEELGLAIESGGLGDIVEKHESLILQYYVDVQDQARQSFAAARSVARIGFWVLLATLLYVFVFDALGRFGRASSSAGMPITVASVGVVSGALIEFIAAINFWLYARSARQFGAFHICLERTHRYLLAYKIADQLQGDKDATLRDLVCIMANAPMITHADVKDSQSRTRAPVAAAVSAEFGGG